MTDNGGENCVIALWPPRPSADGAPELFETEVKTLVEDIAERIAAAGGTPLLMHPARPTDTAVEDTPPLRILQREFPTEGSSIEAFTPEDWILAIADCLIVREPVPGDGDDLPASLLRLLARGLAIIMIPRGSAPDEAKMFWRGFAPGSDVLSTEPCKLARPYATGVAALVHVAALGDPAPETTAKIDAFLQQPLPGLLVRTEYPLLLLLTAGRVPRTGEFLPRRAAKVRPSAANDPVSGTIARDRANHADALAGLYAQKFRSSFVGRFVLSAIVAVAAALLVLLLPQAKAIAFGIEFAATITIVVSYAAATKGRWQEKWLEYRFLAEQLRLIADMPQAAGAILSQRKNPDESEREWNAVLIDRVARQALHSRQTWVDNVVGVFDVAFRNSLDGQINYHTKNKTLMATMERRLGRLGLLLFILSMTIASAAMAAAILAPDTMNRISSIVAAALAFFPACGAAIFAIRIQASFKTEAGRSKLILDRLNVLSQSHQAGDRTGFRHVLHCADEFIDMHADDVARWREIQAARALDLP